LRDAFFPLPDARTEAYVDVKLHVLVNVISNRGLYFPRFHGHGSSIFRGFARAVECTAEPDATVHDSKTDGEIIVIKQLSHWTPKVHLSTNAQQIPTKYTPADPLMPKCHERPKYHQESPIIAVPVVPKRTL
jgi:hypothetical protein